MSAAIDKLTEKYNEPSPTTAKDLLTCFMPYHDLVEKYLPVNPLARTIASYEKAIRLAKEEYELEQLKPTDMSQEEKDNLWAMYASIGAMGSRRLKQAYLKEISDFSPTIDKGGKIVEVKEDECSLGPNTHIPTLEILEDSFKSFSDQKPPQQGTSHFSGTSPSETDSSFNGKAVNRMESLYNDLED